MLLSPETKDQKKDLKNINNIETIKENSEWEGKLNFKKYDTRVEIEIFYNSDLDCVILEICYKEGEEKVDIDDLRIPLKRFTVLPYDKEDF